MSRYKAALTRPLAKNPAQAVEGSGPLLTAYCMPAAQHQRNVKFSHQREATNCQCNLGLFRPSNYEPHAGRPGYAIIEASTVISRSLFPAQTRVPTAPPPTHPCPLSCSLPCTVVGRCPINTPSLALGPKTTTPHHSVVSTAQPTSSLNLHQHWLHICSRAE